MRIYVFVYMCICLYVYMYICVYRKIPIISAGLILFGKPFLGGLFSGGLIIGGGAYYRDDICV